MKFRLLIAAVIVVGVTAWLGAPAHPEEEPADSPPANEGAEDAWAKQAQPGENHEWMGFLVGKWHADVKYWMGPGEPQTATGTSESEWILGKRFIRTTYTGKMEEKTFTAFSHLGFNNATSEYQSVLIESMSTGIVMATGKREGDTLTTKGETIHPVMGKVVFRDVWKKVSSDEYHLQQFWMMQGMGEMKVLEITYKRVP